MSDRPFTRAGDSVRLFVRVTPRASRNAVAGTIVTTDGKMAVAVRLVAPPVDGAANSSLIDFLARTLAVSRSKVRIVAGEASRFKLIEIDGVTDESLERLTNQVQSTSA